MEINIQDYIQKAESGDAEAQYMLAYYYLVINVEDKDKSDDVEYMSLDEMLGYSWLLRAAENNHKDAIRKIIGYYYGLKANLIDKHPEKYYWKQIFKWTKRLADMEDLSAINNLGNYYYWGNGVEQDYKKAVELYLYASGRGHKDATGNLAMCYMKGNGVEVDKEKMKELFELAKTQKSYEDK